MYKAIKRITNIFKKPLNSLVKFQNYGSEVNNYIPSTSETLWT